MAGFWTQTEAGHTVHVNGDPNMSEDTRAALMKVMDALIAEKQVEDKAFKELWSKAKAAGISEDDASWWFNEGIEYQKAQSKKRIEYLERRLREEIEAHKPTKGGDSLSHDSHPLP